MLSTKKVMEAAQSLFKAEKNGRQIPLLSQANPDMTMDDAYAVQDELVRLKLQDQRKKIGWKIGLTSKAMQYALDIDIPDSGVLFDDMVFENGAVISKNRFIQPRIEAELAFILKHDLEGPNIRSIDVLNATAYIVPALEILDTRIIRKDPASGSVRTIVDTIADNAANGGIVTGGRARHPDAIDMRWTGAIVSRNGAVEETGLGAGVLNDPAHGVAWLANRLAQYGKKLEANDIILSGSFIRPIEASSGSTISADFGALGTVAVYFE